MNAQKVALRVILISCILMWSTSDEDSWGKNTEEPARIALIAPLSGPLSDFGWSMLRGARIRMGDSKNRGLGESRNARLMVLDDKGDAGGARRVAESISSHRSMVAAIGHLTTSCTLAAIPIYNAAQIIHISPVATGEGMARVSSPYTFRTILSEGEQASSLADYMSRTLRIKSVALVFEESPLGHVLRNSFLHRSRERGLSVQSISVEHNPFTNLAKAITTALAVRAGAIFVAGGPELAALLVRKLPEDARRPPVFGTYRLVSEEFLELAGKYSKGTRAVHPCVWNSNFKRGEDLRENYERQFKYRLDWVAIYTYDAIDLLLWAIEKAGANPHSIRRAVKDLNSAGNALPGLAGPIWFKPKGSLARDVTVAMYTGSGWKLQQRQQE